MTIEFTEQFGSIEDAGISAFEQRNTVRLPHDYREFVSKHNGGIPVRQSLVSKYFSRNQPFDIRMLLPLTNDDRERESVETITHDLRDRQRRIQRGMLPIADDSFGNLFLISTEGVDAGKIFFWNHEEEADPEDDRHLASPPHNTRLVVHSTQNYG